MNKRRWIILFGNIVVLIMAAYFVETGPVSDFVQDYAAACGWWHGLDPNGRTAHLIAECGAQIPTIKSSFFPQTAHPPLTTLIVLPFRLLPWPLAQWVWLIVSWAAMCCATLYVIPNLATYIVTMAFWSFALAVGAFEPWLFALLSGALVLYRRAPIWSGVLIGLATAIKIYPLVFLIGLLLRGQRRMLIAAVGGARVATLLAEVSLGYGVTQDWLSYVPVNAELQTGKTHNLSLVRIFQALGIPNFVAFIVILAFLTLPLIRHLRSRESDGIRPMIPVMLLATPLVWPHYVSMVGLCGVRLPEQLLLLISSGTLLAVWFDLIAPYNLAPLAYGPIPVVCFLMWWRDVRHGYMLGPDGQLDTDNVSTNAIGTSRRFEGE